MPLNVPSALVLATTLHEYDCGRVCAIPHHVEDYRAQAKDLLAVLDAPPAVLGTLEALYRDYAAKATGSRAAAADAEPDSAQEHLRSAQEYEWRAQGVAEARAMLVTLYSVQGRLAGLSLTQPMPEGLVSRVADRAAG